MSAFDKIRAIIRRRHGAESSECDNHAPQKKSRVGRPTKLTRRTHDAIVNCIASGRSQKDAADEANVARGTLQLWLRMGRAGIGTKTSALAREVDAILGPIHEPRPSRDELLCLLAEVLFEVSQNSKRLSLVTRDSIRDALGLAFDIKGEQS